jgi:hypothetical protein
MNKLFFNNVRNDYNNYENFEFIENFEIENEQNEKLLFSSKKYAIVKLNQLIPANCCISISDKNFLKTENNTYGCTLNQQFNNNCGIDINFWEKNNDKFIIIINKDPENGYFNFATYLDKPVWLGTNNTLEYKFKTFINFDDANNYRNNYLNSKNYLYNIPSYLSYIKINKDDINIIPLNLDNILLCGIEKDYWEKNINKIAIISYIPTYNEAGITNKPFAKYKNNNIWNYTTSELLDLNDIIYNFIIPLNLSIGYKWIHNNLNSKLNLITLNSSLVINSICTTFPSSCSIDSSILTYLNNNNIIFVVVQITNDIFNSPFAYLYNKQVNYIYSNIKETIDNIVQKYNSINNKEYSNLLPINLKNIINNFNSINLPSSEYIGNINPINKLIEPSKNLNNVTGVLKNIIEDISKNNIAENIIKNLVKEPSINLVKEPSINLVKEPSINLVKEPSINLVKERSINAVYVSKDSEKNTSIDDQHLNSISCSNIATDSHSNVINQDPSCLAATFDVCKRKDDTIDYKCIEMQKSAVELTKISQSNIKVISSEDEQKYNNYLEKRLELIDKKREELRFIEMSNMSCCIIISLIMLFVILIFTLCKKKNSKIE